MSHCSITCRTCGNVYLIPEGERLRECAACSTWNMRPRAEGGAQAESCLPYDVFLCHKATVPGSDQRTEDCDRAFTLYHGLTMRGYRVFLAPMEPQGASCEAEVCHALHTARVMLVICSDPEHVNSTRVQSEWWRYLQLMDVDADDTPRTLRPLLYGDMPAHKLPVEFRRRKLQAIPMAGFGADETLMAVVEQFCGVRKAAPEEPAATPESCFTTSPAEGGVAITGYSGPGGEVIIPAAIGGRRVVEIGENAFRGQNGITKVVLPEGLFGIEDRAFAWCTGLTEVGIPASAAKIMGTAFLRCTGLKRFTVAAGNRKYYAQDGVLFSRAGELISYPAGLPADSYAVPGGVLFIGDRAFSWCINLLRVDVPSTVYSIDPTAFLRCNVLKEITVAAGNQKYCVQDGMLMDRDNTLISYPPGRTEESCAVPQGVTAIAACAFNCCAALRRVSIPDSVTEIGFCAFIMCTKLSSVSLPAGVTVIEASAFLGCASLKEVTLPEGVGSIGSQAFEDCTALTSLTIPAGVDEIADNAFDGCTGVTLRVHADSPAHRYAQQKDLRYEVIGGKPTFSGRK